MLLGERLKSFRARKNISQKELAEKLYVSAQAVSKWERNEATPNPETLVKLAEIFEITTDELLGSQKTSTTEDDIKAAFFNGADPTLTPEERDAMWEDAQEYFRFKIEQRRRKQQDGE